MISAGRASGRRAATMPELKWTASPGGKVHAIEPRDLEPANGSVETLCGCQLSTEGLNPGDRPWGDLCIPCVVGAAADLPDPGRMGTVL